MEKRSGIWKYFSVCETEESKAIFKLCKSVISRGGSSARNYTTSAMNNHLSYKHPDEFKDMNALKVKISTSKSNDSQVSESYCGTATSQPTLAEFATRKRQWPIDSCEARRIHEAIALMIAADVQPYSVVEDAGFKNLLHILEPRYKVPSRKFFSTKILPEMYEAVKARVQSDIDAAKSICLTTDTWTSQNTTQSFLSLTAYWTTDNFTRKFAILHCELFEGSRTGARLADALNHMLAD